MTWRAGVVGGGTMGVGIADRLAVSGARVYLVDLDDDLARAAVGRVAAALGRSVERGRIESDDAHRAQSRVEAVGSLDEVPTELDVLIETVFEDLALKREVLAAAEGRSPRVLASNTSSISIDELAVPLRHPDVFAGMHFFNPVWAIDLVEVIRGSATGESAIGKIREIVDALGMEAIVVKDAPGFASSRLGIVLGLEAIRMVEEGVADPADIDRAMELGYRHPMGPLRTGDLVGLDVRLAIAEHLASVYGARFEPPDLLRRMVADGRLGKKSGGGFYDWD